VYRQTAVTLHTAGRQMATLDVAKLLLLTNQTKLTLTVTLTLTDTVTVIFFTRISSTPIERLYGNNKRNFCGGPVAGFVGGPVFFGFRTFYLFADKNSIVSSYFIVEKRVFVWGYIRKRGLVFWGHNRKKETIELRV